jgi:hypothetical protein
MWRPKRRYRTISKVEISAMANGENIENNGEKLGRQSVLMA